MTQQVHDSEPRACTPVAAVPYRQALVWFSLHSAFIYTHMCRPAVSHIQGHTMCGARGTWHQGAP